jgi:AcrR family transcriptional regulator
MITSIPWLKIAPNCGGQCRMHVSQLMQIDMSMSSGGFFHFGFRSRSARRSSRVPAAIAGDGSTGPRLNIDPWVKCAARCWPMEPDRRLTAQGLERKQQLLDCAAELFAQRGYAETRVIDIVRAAGVAKGLFYWYFENKEALFKELAGSIRLNLRREQGAALRDDAPPLVNLYRGTEVSVRFMAEHAHFFSLLEVEGRNFTDVLRQGTQQHINDMVRIVEAGQADGTIRDEDPTLMALGVVGSVGHFSHFHRTGRINVPLPELGAFVARYVVHSVASDEDAIRAALRDAAAAAPA